MTSSDLLERQTDRQTDGQTAKDIRQTNRQTEQADEERRSSCWHSWIWSQLVGESRCLAMEGGGLHLRLQPQLISIHSRAMITPLTLSSPSLLLFTFRPFESIPKLDLSFKTTNNGTFLADNTQKSHLLIFRLSSSFLPHACYHVMLALKTFLLYFNPWRAKDNWFNPQQTRCPPPEQTKGKQVKTLQHQTTNDQCFRLLSNLVVTRDAGEESGKTCDRGRDNPSWSWDELTWAQRWTFGLPRFRHSVQFITKARDTCSPM